MFNLLREHFGVEPKGTARAFKEPYPDFYDTIPRPRGFSAPDFIKFTGDDGRTTFNFTCS